MACDYKNVGIVSMQRNVQNQLQHNKLQTINHLLSSDLLGIMMFPNVCKEDRLKM